MGVSIHRNTTERESDLKGKLIVTTVAEHARNNTSCGSNVLLYCFIHSTEAGVRSQSDQVGFVVDSMAVGQVC